MPMTDLERLGEKIKGARNNKGYTQQELADRCCISLKHLQGIEKGKKNPSYLVLRAIVRVLEISLDSLLIPEMPESEQGANEIRQIYLSCPDIARPVLLGSTRAMATELKHLYDGISKK